MAMLPYKEGTWFGVPLRKGGYAVGLVARHSREGVTVLAHFFGPKRERLPTLDEMTELRPEQASLVCIVGDLGLINGSWPIIGESAHWVREAWPVPAFTSRDDLTKTAWRVRYSDEDPAIELSRERIGYEPGLPDTDGSYGAGAAEKLLSHLLDP